MKKLKIVEVNDYDYKLKDNDNNIYNFNIEFLDINKLPNINDYIYMNEELLDKKYKEYSTVYTFGELKNKTGRKIENEENLDLIVLEMAGEKFYLKRLYG